MFLKWIKPQILPWLRYSILFIYIIFFIFTCFSVKICRWVKAQIKEELNHFRSQSLFLPSPPHCRRSWMHCRTKQRPAAPSLVSLESGSTLPSWWPTVWTSSPALQSLVRMDTSGPQMGKNTKVSPQHHPEKQKSVLYFRHFHCFFFSALGFLRLLKPVVFSREQKLSCTSKMIAKSFLLRTELKVKVALLDAS